MQKGQIYEGKVEKIEFPNKGTVVCAEGEATVKGTIPGQKIRFSVTKKRSGKCQGRLVEVVEKSEMENTIPECSHFAYCGGCSYQTMEYENQLKLKESVIKDILDKSVNTEYEFEGIIASPKAFEYRNKMEFSFGDEYKEGPLSLGLHKRNSFYDVITTDECKIVGEDYNKILRCVLDFFKEKNVPYYHKMRHEGYLRHLVIRQGVKTKELLISIVTASEHEKSYNINWGKFTKLILDLNLDGRIAGIMHIINDSLSDVVKSDQTDVLYGKDYFYEELLDLKFKISTFSFFQTNSLCAERLYLKAREYIGDTKDKVVFDLYSGTGTIAQILAPVAKKVIGVEIVEEAVEAAKENATLNGLSNCEFIAGDVLKVIDEIEDKPDLLVLDPPRDGINPKALKKIINFGVDKIVYISCKPTSLARDLEMLQACGYRVEKACAVDMFPMTVHVETVVLLGNQKSERT